MFRRNIKIPAAATAILLMSLIVAYHAGKAVPASRDGRGIPGPSGQDLENAGASSGVTFAEIDRRRVSIGQELDRYLERSKVRWSAGDREDVVDALLDIEERYGYRPMLFLKLMKVESNFRIDAISKDGAMGLCQIQPETARQVSIRMGSPPIPRELLFDPVINLKLSAHYINYLESKYKALPKAMSAYNMGPGAFSRVYGEGGIPSGPYHDLLSEN